MWNPSHQRNVFLIAYDCANCTILLMRICLRYLYAQFKVCGIHRLGPAYKNAFKFENEAGQTLSENHKKVNKSFLTYLYCRGVIKLVLLKKLIQRRTQKKQQINLSESWSLNLGCLVVLLFANLLTIFLLADR